MKRIHIRGAEKINLPPLFYEKGLYYSWLRTNDGKIVLHYWDKVKDNWTRVKFPFYLLAFPSKLWE